MNLLQNPGLEGHEGPGLPPGWQIHPEPHEAQYRTEQGAMVVEATGRQVGYAWQRPPVEGGCSYRLAARIRTEGDLTAQLRIFYHDETGRIQKRAYSDCVLGDSDWTDLSVTATAPPEAVKATLFFIVFTVGVGGRAWFAEPALTEAEGPVAEPAASPSSAYDVLSPRTLPEPEGGLLLIPRPRELRRGEGSFRITPESRIVLPAGATGAHRAAAAAINRAVWEALGFALPVVDPGHAAETGNILLGERGGQPLFGELAARGLDPAEPPGPEGYRLLVEPGSIVIAGAGQRGTFYGAQTLCQLIEQAGAALPALAVRDWPDHPFRGLHLFSWGQGREFLLREVERVAARFKFSHLVIESSVVNWNARPELFKPGGASREEMAEVVAAARQNLLEPIPLIQSLGHCEWLFRGGANLDICADRERPYAYDPRNPRSYEVILSIMDEAVDLFGARSLHIGHDEVRMQGRFPEPFPELFVQDVDRIASHMRRRGVEVMLWADEVQVPSFAPYLKQLPPDLTMVDWNYHPFRRFSSLDGLHQAGFRTIGASWYNPYNIQSFSRYAGQAGALGMLQTTWTGYRAQGMLDRELPQFGAQVMAGEFFWNAGGYPDPRLLPYDPSSVARKALNPGGLRP